MPTLHVRNVPGDIYTQLQTLARTRQRSLSAEVITILERALEIEAEQAQQAQLLASIRRRRFSPAENAPDSVDLLREDRDR